MKKKGKGRDKLFSYEKKALAIGAIILFVFVFLVGFVNFGGESPQITGYALFDAGSFSLDFWSAEGDGGNLVFVRYIMFFIILMAVYWAISSIVEGNAFVKTLFSGAISYLSVNFILIDEIYSIMTTYSALGVTFMVIIPFIIVLGFTTKLISSGILTLGKAFTQRAIWAGYTIFLIYYIYTSDRSSTGLNWMIIIIGIISALITIFNKPFMKKVREWMKNVADANAKTRMAETKMVAAETRHRDELNKILNDQKELAKVSEKMRDDLEEYNNL
jgi:hypothetical protein